MVLGIIGYVVKKKVERRQIHERIESRTPRCVIKLHEMAKQKRKNVRIVTNPLHQYGKRLEKKDISGPFLSAENVGTLRRYFVEGQETYGLTPKTPLQRTHSCEMNMTFTDIARREVANQTAPLINEGTQPFLFNSVSMYRYCR